MMLNQAGRVANLRAGGRLSARGRVKTVSVILLLAISILAGSARSAKATDLGAKLLANEKTLPQGVGVAIGRLALTRHAYERMWDRFRLKGKPPPINLRRRAALFAGMWKPDSCPWIFEGLSLEADPTTFRIAVEDDGDGCFPSDTPRTMVISIRDSEIPSGALHARFADFDPFKVKRVR